MSGAREHGRVRLAILLGSLLALLVALYTSRGGSGQGQSGDVSGGERSSSKPAPAKLTASTSSHRLPAPLHGEAVLSQPDGLLVVGGADKSGASVNTVSRLDVRTGRVTPTGSLVQPLHHLAVASLSGKILAFGGVSNMGVDTVQSITPGGAAQTVGHLATGMSGMSAVTVGSGIYLLGGYNGRSASASVLQTTDGRAFVRVARFPTPVRSPAVATLGVRVYAFGGELTNGHATNEIQEYDIATEKAVVAGHLPEPISHAAAVTLDGAIYLLGGRRGGTGSDQILRFDPNSNVAVPAGHLPSPVYDGAAGTIASTAFLVGGLGSSSSPLDSVITLR